MKQFFTAIKKINNETGIKWGFNTITFSVNFINVVFIPIGVNISRNFVVFQSAWFFFSLNYMYCKNQHSKFHGYFFNRKSNYFKILFDKYTFFLKKVVK